MTPARDAQFTTVRGTLQGGFQGDAPHLGTLQNEPVDVHG
jgi:hypothetical protein